MKLARQKFTTESTGRRSSLGIAHGFMGNSHNWNSLCGMFVKQPMLRDAMGACYSLDMRNHGTSPHSAEHSCALMATDIEKFILDEMVAPHVGAPEVEPNAPHKSVFMAHSMGGLALSHSLMRQANREHYLNTSFNPTEERFVNQDVKGVMGSFDGSGAWDHSAGESLPSEGRASAAVLVDMVPVHPEVPTFAQIKNDLGLLMKLPLERLSSVTEAGKLLEEYGLSNSQMRNFLLTNLKFVRDKETKTSKAEFKCNLPVLHRDLARISAPDTPAVIEKPVDLPVMFVFGGASPYYSEEVIETIHRYYSNVVEVVVIPEAGHFVHHERPRQFVDAVSPFIAAAMTNSL